MTSVEKMHYLKTCLTGNAARLITNFKFTDIFFVVHNIFCFTWKTLVSRYENK